MRAMGECRIQRGKSKNRSKGQLHVERIIEMNVVDLKERKKDRTRPSADPGGVEKDGESFGLLLLAIIYSFRGL